MFSRRSIPYIAAIGTAFLITVSYVGFRVYQSYVEFQTFMSEVQAFNHRHRVHLNERRTHQKRDDSRSHFNETAFRSASASSFPDHQQSGDDRISSAKLSRSDMMEMFMEWIETGKMSDRMELYIKEAQANNPFLGKVVQRVVSPHGQIHTLLVPEGYEYQEGDVVLRSELDPPMQVFSFGGDKMKLTLHGVEHEVHGYNSIADPYEREVYFNKFTWSIQNGVSMVDVEKKAAAGELDFSLSNDMREYVDRLEAQRERAQWVKDQFAKPLPPDSPPVKVRFLKDEGDDALPGWLRKMEINRVSKSGEVASSGTYSVADSASTESSPLDTKKGAARNNKHLSPADPLDAELEKQLTPVGIEAELSPPVSADRLSKAQRLIEQYGIEDGLQQLRGSDPEAARQFEQKHSVSPTRGGADGESLTQ